uniref:Protein tyrosine phosphatase domain containing 1 n=1 Tax=Mus musculus TaxID=10090 RepID=A0A1Y7VLX3_MOUSE
MAAGVLPQNEDPYSTLVNSSGHAAHMDENSGRPAPKYTKVGERLRHVIPGHMACSMACGGRAWSLTISWPWLVRPPSCWRSIASSSSSSVKA